MVDLAVVTPWLQHGDVFSRVSLATVSSSLTQGNPDGTRPIETVYLDGPAVLMSRTCYITKPEINGSQTPKAELLHFLPLKTVEGLKPDQVSRLRASSGRQGPYGAMYLGDVATFGECYLTLASITAVPVPYFELNLETHAPEDDSDSGLRCVGGRNCRRVGRLNDADLTLLDKKWVLHWVGAFLAQG